MSFRDALTLAPSEYPNRRSKVAGYIHWMCVNVWGYMLLTGNMDIYLKGS